MKFDPQKHHRRSIRLKGYDYSHGAYYVTVVTWHREYLFGKIRNGEMKLNKVGDIVEREWLNLPEQLPHVELGASMVMPNHFHGILFIHGPVGATRLDKIKGQAKNPEGSPLPRGPKPASLGAIIAQFKSNVTKRIWKIAEYTNTPIWQRNYYEHVIRDETDLKNKTDYIKANPMLWDEDDENPVNIK
jgi:putative transposase